MGRGLSSTEENTDDDVYYFNSYALQGGELESLRWGLGFRGGNPKRHNGLGCYKNKIFCSCCYSRKQKSISSVTLSGAGDTTETYGVSFVFDPIEKQAFKIYMGPLNTTE